MSARFPAPRSEDLGDETDPDDARPCGCPEALALRSRYDALKKHFEIDAQTCNDALSEVERLQPLLGRIVELAETLDDAWGAYDTTSAASYLAVSRAVIDLIMAARSARGAP